MEQFGFIHIIFVYFMGILELLYLLFCAWYQNDFKYIFRIRVLLPAYYLSYALVFFTGILMAAAAGFNVDIFNRLFGLIFMFALSIYQFICFKKARKMHNVKAFRKKALIIEVLKIALFIYAGV